MRERVIGTPRRSVVVFHDQEVDHVRTRLALIRTGRCSRRSTLDESEVAAAAFLARYSGRTLDAYRYDLRTSFQWAADAQLAVLEAQRPHIELYRTSMEERQLAPSTVDRRLPRSVGSIGSPTSTAGCQPTQLST